MTFSLKDLIPILMIIASVGGLFGLVQPRYQSIKALQAEKKQYENTLDKANEARIIRETLLAEYNSVKPDDWQKLGKMLPKKADGVQLARDMDGLAKVFGIKLKGFSFTEEAGTSAGAGVNSSAGLPVPPNGAAVSAAPGSASGADVSIPTASVAVIKKLKLSFNFEATYPDFMRFMRELEKSLELADVRSLSLSRAGSSSGSSVSGDKMLPPTANTYSISLKIDTYWIE